MANVKISQLPSLTTMTNEAQVPVVSEGVTYQITGANLTNYFGGSTGNVTFSDQVIQGTGTQDGGGGLYLAPGVDSTANLQYLRVRGGDNVTHIHLDTGNNAYYDQYFGADTKYVKLEANGNVAINADDGANSATWTFGADGKILLPYGAVIQDTAGNAVAIGLNAGQTNQNDYAVAIGPAAGNDTQGVAAVAIGSDAGQYQQGIQAIAIGTVAGLNTQGTSAVAIGSGAGQISQGQFAVALGYSAGDTNQGNNSIIINATGATLDQTTANTFTVAPMRNDVANVAEILFYNTASKEITYGNTISVAGNITGGNLSAVNLVINRIGSDDSSFVTITDGLNVEGDVGLSGGNVTGALIMETPPTALVNLTAVAGGRAFINDANLVAAGNFGQQVGSGGSNTVPVWSDGTNWYIG